MKRLLTFESFVPKNVDARKDDLEKIKAQELIEYALFVKNFTLKLQRLQGVKAMDAKEQLFIDLLQNLQVKVDQEVYPFFILLFNTQDQFMFGYDWKHDIFWCQQDRILLTFLAKFNIAYENESQLMCSLVEIFFGFRPANTKWLYAPISNTIETHFNK